MTFAAISLPNAIPMRVEVALPRQIALTPAPSMPAAIITVSPVLLYIHAAFAAKYFEAAIIQLESPLSPRMRTLPEIAPAEAAPRIAIPELSPILATLRESA